MPIRFDPRRELDRMAQSLGQLLNRSAPEASVPSSSGDPTDPIPPLAGEQANPLPTS